ncbi:MAG: PFL_4669 family integrating conjugative element protein [Panacagrimonas sp.]
MPKARSLKTPMVPSASGTTTPDDADVLATEALEADADEASPGPLRSESWITLQTRQAQRLVTGRRAEDGTPGIVGLTRFAAMLRPLWNAARADDPWADWWLLRVHDAIEQGQQELDALLEHVNRLLKQTPNVSVTVAVSIEPLKVPLTFTNPYAFRGAYLLAKFDDLVRAVLTAKHVAMVDRSNSERLIADGGRQVRRAYNAALGYRFLGITRDDARLMTARIKEAEAQMGALPQEILDSKLRAPFAPDIARATRGMSMSAAAVLKLRKPASAAADSASADGATGPEAVTERVAAGSP